MPDPVKAPESGVIPAFGSLETSIRLLDKRMQEMLARNPETEFSQSEGNVGADYKLTTYSKSENFFDVIPTATPLSNREFMATIFPKAIVVQFMATNVTTDFSGLAANAASLNRGLLLEFYKDQRGMGAGMSVGNPDGRYVVPFDILFQTQTQTPATGINSGIIRNTADEQIPLRYRYVKISLVNLVTGLKDNSNLNTIFGVWSVLSVTFLGD